MNVLDQQRGSVHGLSIPPTAAVSADQAGSYVDLGQGSLVGHVHLMVTAMNADLDVVIDESNDGVNSVVTTTITVPLATYDRGTGPEPNPQNAFHILQWVRNARWAKISVNHHGGTTFSSVKIAAGVSSMLAGDGGGSSRSPADDVVN